MRRDVRAWLAETIKRHAPNAWMINFTNPAGLITQANVAFSQLLGRPKSTITGTTQGIGSTDVTLTLTVDPEVIVVPSPTTLRSGRSALGELMQRGGVDAPVPRAISGTDEPPERVRFR